MNPPALDDDDASPYLGSQPLDLALADRFALQATMPHWGSFPEAQQEAVVLAYEAGPDADAGRLWAAAIARTRELLPVVRLQWAASIARYARILAALLAQSGAQLSALPFAAAGKPLDAARLLAGHREAWRLAAVRPDDPMGRILAERDPLLRVRLALSVSGLPDGELTTIVADALAGAPDGARHALAEWLFEGGALSRLGVLAADSVAEVYRHVACVQEITEQVTPNGIRHRIWKRLQQRLGAEPDTPLAQRRANLLTALFAAGRLAAEDEVDAALERHAEAHARLAGACA